MSERPETLPPLTTARLDEIKDLLRFESSISFQSHRAHESMWMLVAEVDRLRADLADARKHNGELALQFARAWDLIGAAQQRLWGDRDVRAVSSLLADARAALAAGGGDPAEGDKR